MSSFKSVVESALAIMDDESLWSGYTYTEWMRARLEDELAIIERDRATPGLSPETLAVFDRQSAQVKRLLSRAGRLTKWCLARIAHK